MGSGDVFNRETSEPEEVRKLVTFKCVLPASELFSLFEYFVKSQTRIFGARPFGTNQERMQNFQIIFRASDAIPVELI